jgi:hypothetical protein
MRSHASPRSNRPARRRACLALALVLALATVALPGTARASAPTAAPARAQGVPPAVAVQAGHGFFDQILGNRGRMIQVATLAMALAIFILTRSHSKY